MIQKFKRGNLVHIAKDLGSRMSHYRKNVDAIILYSNAYEDGGDNTVSYTVMFSDNPNSSCSYKEDQLTLICFGGENLIKEAIKKICWIKARDTDIKYIMSKLDDGNLTTDSILFLFNLINYRTSFIRVGDYHALYRDWFQFYPIFLHIRNSKTIDEAKSILNSTDLLKYNVTKVYKFFHNDFCEVPNA